MDIQTHKQTDTQTDTQIYRNRQIHRQTHRQTHRYIETDRTNLIRGGERIDELFGNLLRCLELGGSERIRDVYENDKVLGCRRQRTHHDIPVEQTDIAVTAQ